MTVPQTQLHNFPPQPTTFIGREPEIAEIVTLLEKPDCRLLTILAPGGMGKTRISLEAARTQVDTDSIYFIPLAPLSSHQDIVTTIAESIGFVFFGEDAPLQQLANFLKDRAMLLVLDNFEHLLGGVNIVTEIVQNAAHIKLLITSRERLNVRNEVVYHLRGLDFPTWETPDNALQYDAVKLFMQSAKRARSDFELQTDDLDFLARLCRLTAGMPLAIELAAGWVDILSLEQIANEIQQGIDILETDLRDVPERQRSLRATFEQTWNRLSDEEQKIFARLSVFRGGFTLSAAESVAGANLRHLRKLAQKALVQSETNERYTIHELLRQYGASQLEKLGELETVRAKHAIYYADFMAKRKQDIKFNKRQPEALDLIDPDFENVRLAWLYTIDHQVWEELPKFLHSFWFYCDMRSRSRDGIELFEYALEKLKNAPPLSDEHLTLGRVKAWMGWLYNDIGRQEKGSIVCKEAIAILEQYDITEHLIISYHTQVLILSVKEDFETARPLCEKHITLAQQLGDKFWEVRSLSFWSSLMILNHDSDSQEVREQLRVLVDALGTQMELAVVYGREAWEMFFRKDFQQALLLGKQALQYLEPLKTTYHIAETLMFLGGVATKLGTYNDARNYLNQSLRLKWNEGYTHFLLPSLLRMAQLLLVTGQFEKSAEIMSIWSNSPDTYRNISIGGTVDSEKILQELTNQLGNKKFTAIWEHGKQRELSDIMREMLAEAFDEELATSKPVSQPLAEPVSERELEVLALLAEGMTNREIAEKLFLSVGTVKVHTRNIYGKLNVSNRTEAASKARDLKLI